MKKSTYFTLWSKAFGLSGEELSLSDLSIVHGGFYVDRYQDEYVFFYFDELTGKRILACSTKNLSKIRGVLGDKLFDLRPSNIRAASWFKDKKMEFNDVDFCVSEASEFKPIKTDSFDIRTLASSHSEDIEEFYCDCSEDDKDTLDLSFENEVVLGIYFQQHLAGIARYAAIRDTTVADITVLVRNRFRGKGLSTPLVSRLIECIFENRLVPKYRVQETNIPSVAIARKLGFSPRFRLLTWAAEF